MPMRSLSVAGDQRDEPVSGAPCVTVYLCCRWALEYGSYTKVERKRDKWESQCGLEHEILAYGSSAKLSTTVFMTSAE